MNWYNLFKDDLLEKLCVDSNRGLSEEEVKERLEKYGFNEIEKEKRVSPFQIFINQFKNTLIIILLIAIILSALIGEIVDSVIIGIIVVFCALLGFLQEYRAEKALDALKKMLSPTITVLRSGKEQEVPAKEIVPGDILILEAGDKVPADARLIEAHSLRCDEAPLTGESSPVSKNIDPIPGQVQIADMKNMVFAGTTVTYGRAKAVVVATGMNTQLGKIAKEVLTVKAEKTPLEKRTEEIGKWLGIICITICFLVIGISLIRETIEGKVDLSFLVTIVMFAVALAVAAVPEALAAIVTGALAIGMRQMAKENALVRKMTAVETLGCTTVICSDKTGTLTKGEMTVRKIYYNERKIEITGSGYEPTGEFKGISIDEIKNDSGIQMLLKGAVLCNDADLYKANGKWNIKGDPTEGALVVVASKVSIDVSNVRLKNPRIEEIPFSSERKRMTTIHRMEDGKIIVFVKGATEVILERCSYILRNGKTEEIKDEDKIKILKTNEEMASEALRVLALGYKEISQELTYNEDFLESDIIFLGLFGMMDPPRPEVIEAIKVCKEVGIKPIMITGDHKLTAIAVGKEIGIYKEGDMVLTGEELEKISENEFEKIVNKVTVYARVSPLDKLKIVKAWKNRGEVVAMTGDGVNDAPALKHADIGIAMGITGTEVAKEAADMVLTDDNFATIVKAIELGRWIYDNIKKYLTYLLRCNLTEVVFIGGVVIVMGPDFLPLLPAAILYINLATDGLPALALGVAPPDPDIMKRPPRNPKESIFSFDVIAFVLAAFLIEIPTLYYIFFTDFIDITHARTEIFFFFIGIELIIALNFRSLRFSLFKAPPHKWLLLAIAWEIVLIALLAQISPVRESFGITKPLPSDLIKVLAVGLGVLISMEIIKPAITKKISTFNA